jgi:serine/threonine-protein kinase
VAKILDLGLSKNIGGAEQSFYTQANVALGTPHYISPEQARGEKDLDGRADIYSLGATLYHLVTGQTPFEGATPAIIMTKHLNEQLANPRDPTTTSRTAWPA